MFEKQGANDFKVPRPPTLAIFLNTLFRGSRRASFTMSGGSIAFQVKMRRLALFFGKKNDKKCFF